MEGPNLMILSFCLWGFFKVKKWVYWGPDAGGTSSTPGQGTKIPHAMLHGNKKIYLVNK